MWLFLIDGFYSVVADRNNPDNLLVRARDDGDAQRMADLLTDASRKPVLVVPTPNHDYAFRMIVHRDVFARVLGDIARDISYDNFKDEVHQVRGFARSSIYSRVWSFMIDALQGHPA